VHGNAELAEAMRVIGHNSFLARIRFNMKKKACPANLPAVLVSPLS